MTLRHLGFLSTVLLLTVCWQPLRAADEPVPLDAAVLRGRLDNGLRYYVQRNTRPEKRVELRLVVDAGSALEDDDQCGVAHLVEHLCFRGTAHFPHSALISYLQSLGSDFGPHVNAQTSFDETVYRLSVPVNAAGALENGLQILRDWAGAVDFTPEEVQKERQVVIEEWRLRLGAGQRLLDQALPVLFKDSRYANRLPIGKKETVETATVETIRRYYADWYRPDHLAVVVVGEIDPAAVEARLRALFADLSGPASPRPQPDLSVPVPAEWSYSAATDPEFGSNIVRVSFPRPTVSVVTVADYQRRLAENLVVQALNARLAARREQPPAPFQLAQASNGVSLARARTELLLLALVGEGGVPAGLEALVTESERLRRHGLTVEELAREKNNLLKVAEERFAERDKRESDDVASAWVWHALRAEPVPSPDWAYAQAKAALAQLTLAEANATARRLLDVPGALVRVETPAKPGRVPPDVAALRQIVDRVRAATLEPWQEKAAPTALLAQLPEPGTVVARKSWPDIGVTELTLGNGVRVVLKPSTFKQDEIIFSAYRPGGLSALPDELDLAGKFLPGYFGEAGLGDFSKTDLQRLLTGRKVGLMLRLDPCIDLIRGGCSAADLETALQLVHLSFGGLRTDPAAYENVLALNRSFETNVILNPAMSFLNDTIEWRYGGHPRAARLVQPEAAWKALTPGQVVAAHHQRFGSASGFTFFVAGSFTMAAIEPLLVRYLGSLPADNLPHEWRDVGLRQVAGPLERTANRGTDPKALLVLCDAQDATWTLRDTHLLWSLGNILQRTLLDKLRIEQGSVYNLRVGSTLEKIPHAYYGLEIAVPSAPGKTGALAGELNAEIERLRTGGPTPEEMQKEVESQRRTLEKEAQSNGDWLWKLELIYKYDEGFGRLQNPAALSELVTAENLQAAARKYWRTDRWLQFDLQPQAPQP